MKKTFSWKLYFILLAACIISIIAVLPYGITLAGDTLNQAPVSFPVLILLSIVQSSILFAIVLYFGMKLSKNVGLGFSILENYVLKKDKSINIKPIVKSSISIGIATGILIILLDLIFSKLGVTINLWNGNMPPFWMGFLASFYGGIGEEILLRLFFMSFLVWVFSKLKKTDKKVVNNNLIMWSSILLASILFGIGHLPITLSVTALTPLVFTRAILLNGIGGIIFGWLYWKKGLESAIIAHFSTDLALHVILPILLLLN